LHTYDQQRKLVETAVGKAVTAKDVLAAVRRFYIEREKKYKNSVRQVDRLPPALVGAMKRDDISKVDYMDDQVAINTINRYLKNARAIIDAVRVGRFPE
jgi:CRISPR/Cas system-associated protein Cas5 (RAMP superfamily)